jgi:hypothetical protein
VVGDDGSGEPGLVTKWLLDSLLRYQQSHEAQVLQHTLSALLTLPQSVNADPATQLVKLSLVWPPQHASSSLASHKQVAHTA